MGELNFFGITDEEFLAKTTKIITGMAGSAKSSNSIKIFQKYNLLDDTLICTSCNLLKRYAEARYGVKCETIASAVCKTINGIFYCEEKEPEVNNIILDEILLTDIRVIKWVENHTGKYNIIILTDECQMLSPHTGERMLQEFKKLKKKPGVKNINLKKSYRPRTKETEKYYEKCYNSVLNNTSLFYEAKTQMKVIPFSQMEFNHNNIYICHTNEIEKYIYHVYNVADDYTADLIPKGTIARKPPKDLSKYPIMCQIDANGKQIGYLQPINIGSATRYQGSEVKDNQTLYFICESFSRVEAREWYTVVTRCYDIRSIVIVIVDLPKKQPLTVYNHKPVKPTRMFNLPDVKLLDGRKLSEAKVEDDKIKLSPEDIDLLAKYAADTKDIHYDKNKFFFNGNLVCVEEVETEDEKQEVEQEKKTKKSKCSMFSMLEKEPDFSFDYMDDFYRSYEKAQEDRPAGVVETDLIRSAMLTNISNDMFLSGTKKERDKRKYKYGLDLRASYPSILNFEKLPTSRNFFPRPQEMKGDYAGKISIPEKEDRIDWFCFFGSKILPWGSVVTGELARYIQEGDKYGIESCVYIGSSEAKRGSDMGRRLYDMATDCEETNEERKECHYGFAEKPYLDRIITNDMEEAAEAYTINHENNHQLLIIAIKSWQTLAILKIKQMIYNNFDDGLAVADGLYFDFDGDIKQLGDLISAMLPNYNFRIFLNSEEDKNANILYQNYEDLKTREEKRKEYLKEYRKKKKAEGVSL